MRVHRRNTTTLPITITAALFAALPATAVPFPTGILTSVGITAGIPNAGVTNVGEVFYQATFSFYYTGGKVILSANADGTGGTRVDDAIEITVVHPDGSKASYSHNYDVGGCLGYPRFFPPQGIRSKFEIGLNKVTVILKDACGITEEASSLWLTNQ